MRKEINPAVIAWLDGQPLQSMWTTAVTIFEVRFGLEALAVGRRRRHLEDIFHKIVAEDLDGRVLPFDQAGADTAAIIAARQRQAGRPVEVRDVQIAGIAATRKARLATRNTRHFENLGIALIDPWSQ